MVTETRYTSDPKIVTQKEPKRLDSTFRVLWGIANNETLEVTNFQKKAEDPLIERIRALQKERELQRLGVVRSILNPPPLLKRYTNFPEAERPNVSIAFINEAVLSPQKPTLIKRFLNDPIHRPVLLKKFVTFPKVEEPKVADANETVSSEAVSGKQSSEMVIETSIENSGSVVTSPHKLNQWEQVAASRLKLDPMNLSQTEWAKVRTSGYYLRENHKSLREQERTEEPIRQPKPNLVQKIVKSGGKLIKNVFKSFADYAMAPTTYPWN